MHVHRILRGFSAFLTFVTLAAAALPASAQEGHKVDPLDWPHWRGPEMNSISREKGLVSSWSPDGENLLWKKAELATRSTPIVMNGKLYELCRHNPETVTEGEKVVCVNAETGEKIWENVFNVFLTDAPAERVAWSSVVGDPQTGNVYALGLCDYFLCMDGATGKTLWSHSMSEEYGMISTYGGRTNMPLVFDDLVIISGVMTGWGEYAVPAHRFIAFDKSNGQAVWISSTRLRPMDTTYSSPVLANFNGQVAMVFGAGDGSVYAMQPRTGKILWNYDASVHGINMTPTVVGNTVFGGHSEENVSDPTVMGAAFALDGTGTGNITKTDKQLWLSTTRMIGRAAPLFVNNRLYLLDDGATMFVLDPKKGDEIGKLKLGVGRGFSSPLYADGKIFFSVRSGITGILELTEKGVKILHRQRLNDELIHGSTIVSHGRIYIPTSGALYCIGTKGLPSVAADPQPTATPETSSLADKTPAQLQITPVESLLRPGQKQTFKVRLFNANGRYLDTKGVSVTYELKGPGKLEGGVFETPADNAHSASFVTAKVGALTSTARIRTIPMFPWTFDFSNGKVPETWIGAGYRHIIVDDDLLNALKAKDPARRANVYLPDDGIYEFAGGEVLGCRTAAGVDRSPAVFRSERRRQTRQHRRGEEAVRRQSRLARQRKSCGEMGVVAGCHGGPRADGPSGIADDRRERGHVQDQHDPQGDAQPGMDGAAVSPRLHDPGRRSGSGPQRQAARHGGHQPAVHAGPRRGRARIADSLVGFAARTAFCEDNAVSLEARRLVYDEIPERKQGGQGNPARQSVAPRRSRAGPVDHRSHR